MKAYFILFCYLYVCAVASQNIKGVVYDEAKQPVAGALVYLDGTSAGTLTDEKGLFVIAMPEKMYTALVVNYLGYSPVFVSNPFAKSFHNIRLVPLETPLNEVTVVQRKKSKFTRKDKLTVFHEQFLGRTIAGKSCRILNESDLELHYDMKKNRLVATSDVPIRIHNDFLGYEIDYRIRECYIDFSRKTINSSAVNGWSFLGSAFFKDLTTSSNSYAAKRMMSYNASQMQFFRNLSTKTINQSNFRLLRGSRRCNPDQYFTVENRGNEYFITVQNKNLKPNDPFYQSFILEYPGKPDSEIILYTNTFIVDKFGNNSAYRDILFLGDISTKRIGDLLPLDYKSK